jgi:hypothetical protein
MAKKVKVKKAENTKNTVKIEKVKKAKKVKKSTRGGWDKLTKAQRKERIEKMRRGQRKSWKSGKRQGRKPKKSPKIEIPENKLQLENPENSFGIETVGCSPAIPKVETDTPDKILITNIRVYEHITQEKLPEIIAELDSLDYEVFLVEPGNYVDVKNIWTVKGRRSFARKGPKDIVNRVRNRGGIVKSM